MEISIWHNETETIIKDMWGQPLDTIVENANDWLRYHCSELEKCPVMSTFRIKAYAKKVSLKSLTNPNDVKQHPLIERERLLAKRRKHLRTVYKSGIVYFVQHANGLIKIGFTYNLYRRFMTLKSTECNLIRLIGFIQASMNYEKRLHTMFASRRVRGEWFRPNNLLRFYIKTFTIRSNYPGWWRGQHYFLKYLPVNNELDYVVS